MENASPERFECRCVSPQNTCDGYADSSANTDDVEVMPPSAKSAEESALAAVGMLLPHPAVADSGNRLEITAVTTTPTIMPKVAQANGFGPMVCS